MFKIIGVEVEGTAIVCRIIYYMPDASEVECLVPLKGVTSRQEVLAAIRARGALEVAQYVAQPTLNAVKRALESYIGQVME